MSTSFPWVMAPGSARAECGDARSAAPCRGCPSGAVVGVVAAQVVQALFHLGAQLGLHPRMGGSQPLLLVDDADARFHPGGVARQAQEIVARELDKERAVNSSFWVKASPSCSKSLPATGNSLRRMGAVDENIVLL